MQMHRYPTRWEAIRRGRGDLPPLVDGLEFFGDLSSPNTSIVSGAVATLGDSSGKGKHFTQSMAGRRPTYNATDALFNNLPSMTFNGIDNSVQLAVGNAFPAMSALTIYVVSRAITVPATAMRVFEVATLGGAGGCSLFIGAAATTFRVRFDSSAALNSSRDSAAATMANANRIVAVGDVAAGGALWTTYLNGVAGGSNNSTAAGAGVSTSTLTGSAIGSFPSGSTLCLNGTVATALLYSRLHSAPEVARVDDWLKWRYGL